MAVYVDDMFAQYGRMKMCHMIADTRDELLEMVRQIGVNPKWIQAKDTPREHFDVCASKRLKAIECGAVAITWAELGEMTLARRKRLVAEGSPSLGVDMKRRRRNALD